MDVLVLSDFGLSELVMLTKNIYLKSNNFNRFILKTILFRKVADDICADLSPDCDVLAMNQCGDDETRVCRRKKILNYFEWFCIKPEWHQLA